MPVCNACLLAFYARIWYNDSKRRGRHDIGTEHPDRPQSQRAESGAAGRTGRGEPAGVGKMGEGHRPAGAGQFAGLGAGAGGVGGRAVGPGHRRRPGADAGGPPRPAGRPGRRADQSPPPHDGRRSSGGKFTMLCWNFTSTATMPRWKRCPSAAGKSRPMAGTGPIRPTCRSGMRLIRIRAAACGRPPSSRFHRSAENGIDIPGAKKYNKSVYCIMNEGNI